MLTTTLRNIRDLYGYRVWAGEDEIGKIKEFYIQEDEWRVRTIAVTSSVSFIREKEIYLPSQVLEEVDPQKRVLFIQQTKQEIQNHHPELEILERNPLLKPAQHFLGLEVRALDGQVGHVEDLILNDADLAVRYLVVHSEALGKKFVLSPWWIEKIGKKEHNIVLGFTFNEVCQSPEYDFNFPMSSEYEEELYDYYGRNSYWA